MQDDALIHLRVPATLKGRWVAESRKQGQKLTEWIVRQVENDMQFTVEQIIQEVAALALDIGDMTNPSAQTREGVQAIQQAAQAFHDAQTSAQKIDAALWVNEAYHLMSSGLPDTGHGERVTGWATANQMSRMMGGDRVWEEKVQRECSGESL